MAEKDATCETCRFYDRDNPRSLATGGAICNCRRNAPVPYVAGTVNPQSPYKIEAAAAWPLVLPDDWCGEYQPVIQLVEDSEWSQDWSMG